MNVRLSPAEITNDVSFETNSRYPTRYSNPSILMLDNSKSRLIDEKWFDVNSSPAEQEVIQPWALGPIKIEHHVIIDLYTQ